MQYSSNPKHSEPWQRGKKGTLCPLWSRSLAQELLNESDAHPDASKNSRYATCRGVAFEARPHGSEEWHGCPVGWNEVPPSILNKWLREKKVRRSDVMKDLDSSGQTNGKS